MEEITTKNKTKVLYFALGTIAFVGLYDLCIGIWMLASAAPWSAHGPDTIWLAQSSWISEQAEDQSLVLMSLFRRMGAFSLFAGAVSLYVAFRYRTQSKDLLGFMVLYMLAGLGFAATDAQFFNATPYYWFKQVIGGFWFIATIALWRSTKN